MNTRCIVLGLGGLLLVTPAKYAGSDAKPPEVEVAHPVEREVTDYEIFAGRIDAAARVDLRARVTGYVTKVHFKPAENVSKGQVLFEIDPRPYQAALELAEAQLLLADAKLKRWSAELDRAKELVRLKAMSREDFDKIVADRAELEAGRRIAVAGIDLARLNVDFAKVTAPIDGKISAPALTAGNLAKADETRLASIDSVDSVRVVFNVDEVTVLRLHDLLKERKGKKTSVSVIMGRSDDEGFPHSGMLDLADLRIDLKTGTIACRAVFPNADGTLMPGMSARVRVGPYKTLTLDARAMRDRVPNGINYVLVVNEKNIVEKREVQLRWHQGFWRVKNGLKAEDWVVVKGAKGLIAGMIVQTKRVVMPDPSVAPPKKLPENERPAEVKPASAKLKELLKERHAVLTKAAEALEKRWKTGPLDKGLSSRTVMLAHRAALQAGLEYHQSPAERIDLLRKYLNVAEKFLALAEAEHKAGEALSSDVLQARAMVLDVQIRLLREEEKTGK